MGVGVAKGEAKSGGEGEVLWGEGGVGLVEYLSAASRKSRRTRPRVLALGAAGKGGSQGRGDGCGDGDGGVRVTAAVLELRMGLGEWLGKRRTPSSGSARRKSSLVIKPDLRHAAWVAQLRAQASPGGTGRRELGACGGPTLVPLSEYVEYPA